MRQVHPDYEVVTVQCACGASFQTRSTKTSEFQVEVCAECHPFYTGKQKLADREGRVEKFKKRYTEGEAAAGVAGPVKRAPAKAVQMKKPPKVVVVPIEVKATERFGDDKRGGRGGGGGGRGRGGPGGARGAAGGRGKDAAVAAPAAEGAEGAAPAEATGGDAPAKE